MDLKSNEPFWLIKNGIMHSYPSLNKDIVCDVLVVGGGITGSLIAHQCIEDGFNTVIIDRRELANGSTSATTSMLQYEIDVPLYELIDMIGYEPAVASYKACADSIDTLRKVSMDIKSKAGYKYKKSLYYAAQKKHVPMLKKEFEARVNAGFNVKWLNTQELTQKYGIYNTYGGILSQKGASVDAFMLTHELNDHNVGLGLRVFDKTELTEVKVKGQNTICETSTGHTIQAQHIIYCTGFESVRLIKEKFVKLISTYAIVSEVNPQEYHLLQDLLVWNTSDPYIYLRMTQDGRVLIGGEDEEFKDPKRRDALITKKQTKLVKHFKSIFPDKTFISDFAWAGTFGTTKDGLPYIGPHPDHPNAYFVLGFGGNGITFSVQGMEMVSYWLKGKKHPLSPYFAFGR